MHIVTKNSTIYVIFWYCVYLLTANIVINMTVGVAFMQIEIAKRAAPKSQWKSEDVDEFFLIALYEQLLTPHLHSPPRERLTSVILIQLRSPLLAWPCHKWVRRKQGMSAREWRSFHCKLTFACMLIIYNSVLRKDANFQISGTNVCLKI